MPVLKAATTSTVAMKMIGSRRPTRPIGRFLALQRWAQAGVPAASVGSAIGTVVRTSRTIASLSTSRSDAWLRTMSAVPEHGHRQLLDVIGDHVVATADRGEGLRRLVEVERAARRGAEVDVGVLAGRAHQANDVVGHALVDVDLLHPGLHLAQLRRWQDLLAGVDRVEPLLLVEDDQLLHRLGIAEPDAEQESVQLRLGQGERALVLDRVLGGDHEERPRHLVADAVDRPAAPPCTRGARSGSWASPG